MSDEELDNKQELSGADAGTSEDSMDTLQDQQDNSVLDGILGLDSQGGDEGPEHTEVNEDTQEAQKEDDSDDRTSAEPEGSLDGYDKAVAALQRDGVPREIIDSMADSDPDGLLQWGLKRLKNQSDVDGYGAKLKDLEAKLDTQGGEKDQESSESTDNTDGQPQYLEEITRNEEKVAEFFGEDAAKALMAPMRTMLQETTNALKQQQQVIDNLRAEAEDRSLVEVRGKLTERFPRLENEDDFGQVMDQMGKLVQTGDYDSYEALMTDAYRMKFAEDIVQTASLRKRNALRDGGQPTTTAEASTPPTSKSIEDREDAALEALLGGGDRAAASKAYNG